MIACWDNKNETVKNKFTSLKLLSIPIKDYNNDN